ncbi:hypothetical protein [Chelativorans sp. AA-79]|uniref:hypothetical protein n=1 Tax=Chelativorans sp. AA-79 TaxID=3028735 RepID=UPI0023F6E0A5|nr:hypothetical protein [Chelativorans sp. AA-79]WEX07735.1 hypothetical protein PVE73_16695 [Chelativorans sp. AA-79]
MKLSMQLTLDGLVRAMRVKAHELADAVESGGHPRDEAGRRPERRAGMRRGDEDDGGDT